MVVQIARYYKKKWHMKKIKEVMYYVIYPMKMPYNN